MAQSTPFSTDPGAPSRRRDSKADGSALERYLAELETLRTRSGLALEAARLLPRHGGSDLAWSSVMREMHAVREVFARSFEHYQSQATDGLGDVLREPPT